MSGGRKNPAQGPASFGTGPISIRTRFERFPASVKGAFVIRGEGRDPHQVRLREARVSRFPRGSGRPIPMERTVLQIAPHRDVFIPFEFPLIDFEPGWYDLVVEVDVDGSPLEIVGDRRFAVGWPRGAVHRGRTVVGAQLTLEDGTTVEVERLDCEATTTTVHYRVSPPGDVGVWVDAADGELALLEAGVAADTGRAKAVAYPVLAGEPAVVVSFALPRQGRSARRASASVEVRLR